MTGAGATEVLLGSPVAKKVTLSFAEPDDDDLPPKPSRVKRSMSFTGVGSIEQVPARPLLVRGKSCAAALSYMGVMEPPTPRRRGSTTDELVRLSSLASRRGSGSAGSRKGSFADLGLAGFDLPAAELEEDSDEPKGPQDDCMFDFDDLPPVQRGFSAVNLAVLGGAPSSPMGGDEQKSPSQLNEEDLFAVHQFSPSFGSSALSPNSARFGAGRNEKRHTSAPPRSHADGLRVAILANGSDGDLMPLLALAQCLVSEHHHTVRAFTNANLVSLALQHGIDAVSVFADTRAVFERLGGISGSTEESVNKGWLACQAWLKANPGACVAAEDALREFEPHALICGAGTTGPGMRYEHTEFVPAMQVWLQRESLELFQEQLQLEPTRPQFLTLSSMLDPEPLPKAHRLHRTAAWFSDVEPSAADLKGKGALSALRQFLAAGPPPVAIGWGSMIVEGMAPGKMLTLALGALRRAGLRGVVLGGWAQLHQLGPELAKGHDAKAAFVADQVCFVPSAPHSWLLPQCRCLVHHGGIGTTHAVLRAGIPSVVTPVFADQFGTAKAVSRLHVGYGFEEALPHITEEQLWRALMSAEEYAPKARELAEQLNAEKGVKHAASIIDTFLRKEVKTEQWERKARRVRQQAQRMEFGRQRS